MKNNNKKRLAFVFVLVLIVGFIAVLISMGKIDKQSEDTTTLFSARVSYVSVRNEGKTSYIEIGLYEYDNAIVLPMISSEITNEVIGIKRGEEVYFRVDNAKVGQMNIADYVDIVALRTETGNILSLEHYNEYMRALAKPGRISGCVAVLILTLIDISLAVSIIKQRRGNNEAQIG